MLVTVVEVYVKPEYIAAFIAAISENHENSVKEPGNMRFDVLQSASDPAQFFLYEAYESEDSSKAHKETPHYKKWKETVEPMMAKPRKGTPCNVICPAQRMKW
ncbi:antibiotic biosynthesis monooxygenase [Candidatus Magnetominusculus xianensis]|uniref:Antibiotic biosynthesis monooxygenase n=1 Tax=Candidatus Magnetominusculus xianensis TaxID=1748249 RepID=A0ABR5SH05_9BACT|nr:antibiotic biosynthesis monooxygenase [Candidatus Magnetominusculus xianensis]KWT90967.1 antibiotic biosynthesis monooxygenase [Candidatus Magnetominusculus xianensis]MBF0403122.1 antibiotic biosynthesis monooxygenase [Nitrospirota bacterium]